MRQLEIRSLCEWLRAKKEATPYSSKRVKVQGKANPEEESLGGRVFHEKTRKFSFQRHT